MKQIEIEFKNLLSKTEFIQLMNQFELQPIDFSLQENHYFDSPTFTLKEKGSALRIRSKNSGYEFTLKQPAPVGILETTQRLTSEQAQAMLSGKPLCDGLIQDTLLEAGVNVSTLEYFGSLKTKRAELQYKSGLLVLDHSSYLGTEDYELEFEVEDYQTGEQEFQDLLSQFGIPIRHTENKIKRFYLYKLNSQRCTNE